MSVTMVPFPRYEDRRCRPSGPEHPAQVSVFSSHRFLLHISCQSPVLDGPVIFSVVETNAFKHLNHLSLRLVQGSDKEIKEYLAQCLSSLKVRSSDFMH